MMALIIGVPLQGAVSLIDVAVYSLHYQVDDLMGYWRKKTNNSINERNLIVPALTFDNIIYATVVGKEFKLMSLSEE